MEQYLIDELKEVVGTLEKRAYDVFFKGKYKSRVQPSDFERVLNEYGGVLTTPPETAYSTANTIKLNSGGWIVEFNLWLDGSESDLSIVLEIGIANNLVTYVEISDMLVL